MERESKREPSTRRELCIVSFREGPTLKLGVIDRINLGVVNILKSPIESGKMVYVFDVDQFLKIRDYLATQEIEYELIDWPEDVEFPKIWI